MRRWPTSNSSAGLITEGGEVPDEGTAEFLLNYISDLHEFIARVLAVPPHHA
ncbi:hypothetical protein WKW77_25255 [Variovorax ureilyticus]|uniref:Uncharacterized protein n=1 Tax=Variovorax ureilyticus TaxID=1836198 RepID=A0ABU8VL87_9BURK